jgi:hypothetical protein
MYTYYIYTNIYIHTYIHIHVYMYTCINSVGTGLCYFFFNVFGGPLVRWLFLEQVQKSTCFTGTKVLDVFGGPLVRRLFFEQVLSNSLLYWYQKYMLYWCKST